MDAGKQVGIEDGCWEAGWVGDGSWEAGGVRDGCWKAEKG